MEKTIRYYLEYGNLWMSFSFKMSFLSPINLELLKHKKALTHINIDLCSLLNVKHFERKKFLIHLCSIYDFWTRSIFKRFCRENQLTVAFFTENPRLTIEIHQNIINNHQKKHHEQKKQIEMTVYNNNRNNRRIQFQ